LGMSRAEADAKGPDLSGKPSKKFRADWRITKGTLDGGEIVVQDDIRVRELEQTVAQLRQEVLTTRAEAAEVAGDEGRNALGVDILDDDQAGVG